ncbi:MAG: hypothetical protein JNM69_20495 [Archangium sp.]|nr:hypothetical protein [Archangium sp.]
MRHVSKLERIAAASVMDLVAVVHGHHAQTRQLARNALRQLQLVKEAARWQRVQLAVEALVGHVLEYLDESELVMLARIERVAASTGLGFGALSAYQHTFGIVMAGHGSLHALRRELEWSLDGLRLLVRPEDETALRAVEGFTAALVSCFDAEQESLQLALEPFLARVEPAAAFV